MLIPRSLNSRVQVIVANAGTIGRISYNPKAPAKIHEMQAEMECANEVGALRTITYSLTQFNEHGFKGEALIISFAGKTKEGKLTGPIIRCWEMVKLAKAGQDLRSNMLKQWMCESDEHADLVQALEELIDAYEACEAKVSFAPIKNAYAWEVDLKGQTVPAGAFLKFDPITNEASSYVVRAEGQADEVFTLEVPVTAEIKLKGEYKVISYGNKLCLERPNNSKEMIDVLKAIEMAKALIPEFSVETAEVVTGTDGF